jgi:peptidoglycan-associated lipoprotein
VVPELQVANQRTIVARGWARPCRRSLWTVIALFALFAFLSGCTKPIVKRTPSPTSGTGFVGAPGPGSVAEGELGALQTRLRTIYFDYDQFTLTPQAQAALQYDADVLKRVPNAKVVAEGHCDERGTDEYNLALGERRARSVAGFLASLGIASGRISTVSYGSELPADPGHNEAAWAKNRRVYLRVSQ